MRLIGSVRPEAAARGGTLGWEDVSAHALSRMPIEVKEVHWFSTYHVHHRVAEPIPARGASFLLGDAAHVHSPVGGQGMNTGIGDAVNLAWKLAAVLRRRRPAALLDTYEPERIGFARRLVATTDRAFQLVTRDSALAAAIRTRVVPRILGALVSHTATRRFLFRTVSQIEITYRRGPLAEGRAGKLHGADRMPFVPAPSACERRRQHASAHGARLAPPASRRAPRRPAVRRRSGSDPRAAPSLDPGGREGRLGARRCLPGQARRIRRLVRIRTPQRTV